ncbi:MAG: hypothetical protein ACKO2Z_35570, partial [Sphaerospermopsis kisseleviana]
DELKGIAYGFEEVEYARQTLHEVRHQQEIHIKYGEESVRRFVNDMISLICDDTERSYRNAHVLKVKDIFPVQESVIIPEGIPDHVKKIFVNVIPKIIKNEQELEYLKFLLSS